MGIGEKIVRANGVDLCVEAFGSPADPAVLLIGGAAGSMDYWEDEFCARLAAGGRWVIRYDLRDTGRSVSYEAGAPRYTGTDLVADVVGLLDVFELARAHLVGISMGGGLAQRLCVDHPERVASLTLISTSPGGPGSDLPPPAEHIQAIFQKPRPDPDWSDRSAVIAHMVAGERPFVGPDVFDAEHAAELAARMYDRTTNIAAGLTNHWILEGGGEPVRPRLKEIAVPTLVMHGTADPLFPYGHAEALAAEIPGARLIPLPGVGHQMPPKHVWDLTLTAILEHSGAF